MSLTDTLSEKHSDKEEKQNEGQDQDHNLEQGKDPNFLNKVSYYFYSQEKWWKRGSKRGVNFNFNMNWNYLIVNLKPIILNTFDFSSFSNYIDSITLI